MPDNPVALTRSSVHPLAQRGARPIGLGRRLIATAGSLAAAAAIPMELLSDPFFTTDLQLGFLFIPTLLCVIAAVLLHRPHLGGQMLARATWWSNLILGSLISVSSSGDERAIGFMLAVGSGSALLAMGRAGLGDQSTAGRFHPIAFRGSLIVAMVMALADTQSLLLFGGISAMNHDPSVLPLVCASVMLLAVVGLYRLAVWGLALNLVANAAIAGLGLAGMLEVPDPIVGALVATAVLQLALPMPLLVAFVRGRRPQPRATKHAWPLLAMVITAMMALSVYATLLHPGRLMHF